MAVWRPRVLPPFLMSGSVSVVVVTMMTVMVLCRKSRRSKEHNHGEKQGLFHDQIIATKG
jgi:hypothetical protein